MRGDDLRDPLVAQVNDRGDGAVAHPAGMGIAHSCVPCFAGGGVALDGGSEFAFVDGHKRSLENLTPDRKASIKVDMVTFRKTTPEESIVADYVSADDRFFLYKDYAPRIRKRGGFYGGLTTKVIGYTLREPATGREWMCESMRDAKATAEAVAFGKERQP